MDARADGGAVNISEPFVRRPVATTLLTVGVALAGVLAFFRLPVSPLPEVDYPTISVQASQPGASPAVMATSVATPLERYLGTIANVTEMTSTSSLGSARITLQFGLDRDINGAARDVQAAINAAHADLPASLRSNPTYRKVNPADAPIMILALTSRTLSQGQLYDAAASILQQKLSQVSGIGQVDLGGSSLPAVRVELEPRALFRYGIGLEDVRAAIAAANANSPKGAIETGGRHYQVYTNDQARQADQYRGLVIAYRNGAAVRLADVAEVVDSVEDLRNQGLANGQPSVLVILRREPGANIIDTVDRVKALVPELRASIPAGAELTVASDRTTTIRASLRDVELTLVIAVALVILVVFLFLRSARATVIPGVAVPISLLGTLGVMYLLGYSIDNLSLMALTIATGFVVDDAIVVMENITRYVEAGVPRREAALRGAAEVGFTVLSMSLSLIAVFIPILLMSGILGRLFREFAITLSVAILVSLAVSLTTTPMMCAYFIPDRRETRGRLSRGSERAFDWLVRGYARTLDQALRHPLLVVLSLVGVLALNAYLYVTIPKGFFPQQDTGRLTGRIQADQSTSFQLMREKLTQFVDIVRADPAVDAVVGFTGGAQANTGSVFVSLKSRAERRLSIDEVMARLRRKLARVAGATLFLQPVQDIRMGGRQSNALYQYTLQADSLDDLRVWTPRLAEALSHVPEMVDVSSDQQDRGLQVTVQIDRPTASRLGLTASQIDNTLYDAFGQRQVSTIYNPLNQYHVVMEVAPPYWQDPNILREIYVSTAAGGVRGAQGTNAVAGTVSASKPAPGGATTTAASVASDTARNQASNQLANTGRGGTSTGAAVATAAETMVPLAAFATFGPDNTPLAVNHQGHFVASTISFNLAPGRSLSDAGAAITETMAGIGMPASIHGSFQGTARVFQESLANELMLILAALAAMYVVLGMLYESYIHPITILSTLPSAGVGALLALVAFRIEFSLMAMIGVLLLIGIVKKNAIMMIDFAVDAERRTGKPPREAIREACLLRFRPIMMTTMAALLGAVSPALGFGEGAELRQPLGISIVGGLILSQILTLYTTPVIYLYLDRFRLWALGHRRPPATGPAPLAAARP
jgi:multidrug efflux pump